VAVNTLQILRKHIKLWPEPLFTTKIIHTNQHYRKEEIFKYRMRNLDVQADLLDISVAKLKFNKVVHEIQNGAAVYESIWKIREIFFPFILIDIFSQDSKYLYILVLNFRNFDFFPPIMTLITPRFEILPKFDEKMLSDGTEVRHIWNNKEGVWFCMPGTFQYHDFNKNRDPWELIRCSPDFSIINLIEIAINMIKR
jgi:hypothetical protein